MLEDKINKFNLIFFLKEKLNLTKTRKEKLRQPLLFQKER